jgi:hypothetical protein
MGWPSEGSLDKVIVNRVFEVVVGELGTPRWFLMLTAGKMSPQLAHVAKAPPRGSMWSYGCKDGNSFQAQGKM